MAYTVPNVPTVPQGLNYLDPNMNPNQISTNIATRGLGAGTGLERSQEVQNYLGSLLANQLLDPTGNIVGEYGSLPPTVRNYFTNQLGYSPTSTADFLSAIGLDTGQPITPDKISQAIRNLNPQGKTGGDRAAAQGGAGRAMSVAAPSLGQSLGAALGAAALAPGLAAPIGLGSAALGVMGALSPTGVGMVGGPNRPGMTTTAEKNAFHAITGAGPDSTAQGGGHAGVSSGGLGSIGGTGPATHGGSHGGAAAGGGPGGRSAPEGHAAHDRGFAEGGVIYGDIPNNMDNKNWAYNLGYACGGLVKKHFADGGSIGQLDPAMLQGMMAGGAPDGSGMGGPPPGAGMAPPDQMTAPPAPPGSTKDDTTITAQTGEYVVSRPAVEMFGPEFFDTLNHLAQQNPNLDPKSVLKAATPMIPKVETQSNKGQPGNLGARLGSALGKGNFAGGGLIGANPVKL